jgi:hypothetical protein
MCRMLGGRWERMLKGGVELVVDMVELWVHILAVLCEVVDWSVRVGAQD